MRVVYHPVSLIATFLWIGFIVAISFMEAWLKFRAEGVTLPIGLGIGRLVFDALNKAEWLFAIAILLDMINDHKSIEWNKMFGFFIPLVLLIVQTAWLLPALDYRADQIIQGQILPSSRLHIYYVSMEVVKVVCLFVFGISVLNIITKDEREAITRH